MIATYAGVSVRLPDFVTLLELDLPRPVFHEASSTLADRARCGARYPQLRAPVRLPVRHARRFARPCLRCFPQFRGQAELEVKAAPL